jgi:multiple sugar transport system substrate-binding protein
METRLTRRKLITAGTKAGASLGIAKTLGTWVAARPSPARAAAKAVVLGFWVIPFWKGRTGKESGGKESDYYDWQIAEFRKQYPNVTIKVEFIPSTFEGWAKFDTAVAAGSPPDVMWGQTGNQWKYAPQGAIESFDAFMPQEVKSDLLGSLASMITYADGKTYIWPYGVAVAGGIFVNMDLAKKFNATSLVPLNTKERSWTVDQFLKLAQACTQGSGSSQVYGVAMMTDWTYQMNQFLYGFGADLYNKFQTKMIANSPEGVEGLQWLVDLEHKHKVAAPGTAGRENSEALRLFQEQKIAILPSQPYYITAFRSAPDLKPPFSWTFLQPPHKEGKKMGAEANVHGYLVAKQRDPDKREMAMRFVQFLTRPEALEIAAWAQGVVPPRKSMLKILAGDPDRYVEGLIGVDAKPWGRLYSEIGPKVWTPMYDSAFSLKKTPKQALDDGVTAADAIISDAAAKYKWPVK